MVDVRNMETNEITPCRNIIRIVFFHILQREIDFYIGELACLFGGLNLFEFHQSGSIRAETVFFDEERNHNTIEEANEVFTIYPVEYIIGEGKRELALHTMRFIEHANLENFVLLYHTRNRNQYGFLR